MSQGMLQRAITPQLSSEIIELLIKKRGWSIPKIAKKIGASRDYVLRVRRATQNFEYADVENLARACHQETHLFVFEAMQPKKMTAEQRDLYRLTQGLIESHQEFRRAMRRKRAKTPRSRAQAA